MSQRRNTVITVVAALIVAAATGGAFASAGVADGNVSIHSGPTTHSSVVDRLYAGESVDIRACDEGWCYIKHPGPDGWVPAGALEQQRVSYDDEGPAPSIGGVIVIGPGHHHHKPWPPVIVDPVPPKPIHPPISVVGNLPVKAYPISGGSNGNPGGNSGGNSGGNICQINPAKCLNLHPKFNH